MSLVCHIRSKISYKHPTSSKIAIEWSLIVFFLASCEAQIGHHLRELRDPPYILYFFSQHVLWEQNGLYMTNGVGFNSSFVTCQLASLKQLNFHQLIWTLEGRATISFYPALCKLGRGILCMFAEQMTLWEPQFFMMKNNNLVLHSTLELRR